MGTEARTAFMRASVSSPLMTGMVKSSTTHSIRSASRVENIQPARAIFGQQDLVPVPFERLFGDGAHRLLVVHHQDEAGAVQVHGLRCQRNRLFGAAGAGGGQEDAEGGALSQGARNLDGAAVAAHDSEHGRQAQPASGELGGKERVEDARQSFFIHAASGIGDLNRT